MPILLAVRLPASGLAACFLIQPGRARPGSRLPACQWPILFGRKPKGGKGQGGRGDVGIYPFWNHRRFWQSGRKRQPMNASKLLCVRTVLEMEFRPSFTPHTLLHSPPCHPALPANETRHLRNRAAVALRTRCFHASQQHTSWSSDHRPQTHHQHTLTSTSRKRRGSMRAF